MLRLTATFDEAGYSNPFYGKNGWEDWRSYTKSKPYASGSVNSFGKFSMRYGRVAVRARFNVASGAWPAIWMLGTTQTPPPLAAAALLIPILRRRGDVSALVAGLIRFLIPLQILWLTLAPVPFWLLAALALCWPLAALAGRRVAGS